MTYHGPTQDARTNESDEYVTAAADAEDRARRWGKLAALALIIYVAGSLAYIVLHGTGKS